MKKHFTICLIFALAFPLLCFSQTKSLKKYSYYKKIDYPSFEAIQSAFYQIYSQEALPPNYKYEFAKMPEGIYVYECIPGQAETCRNFRLFWNNSGFQKLEIPENTERTHLSSGQNYRNIGKDFDMNLFFNYPDWELDVIQLLKDERVLPDDHLYSLANAYYTLALKNIYPIYKFQTGFNEFDKNFDLKDLPEEKLQNSIKYFKLGDQMFSKLQKQNPAFKAKTGNIAVHAACKAMDAYLFLSMVGLDSVGRTFIKDNLFQSYYISNAKNILSS